MRNSDKFDPPENLKRSILFGIRKEERRRARIYLFVSVFIAPSSAFGIWVTVQSLIQEFYQSGFYTYSSLLFSDTDIVLSYWREFILSMAESLPITTIILSLTVFAVFLISVRVISNNLRFGLNRSFSHS